MCHFWKFIDLLPYAALWSSFNAGDDFRTLRYWILFDGIVVLRQLHAAFIYRASYHWFVDRSISTDITDLCSYIFLIFFLLSFFGEKE